MANNKTANKLTGSIIMIIILAICLCITTFALILASVSVEENIFHTGIVKINLNDGKPVIEEYEYLFEPGMTVQKSFFIESTSTDDVYYKLYFDNIEGGLADVLGITILDGDTVLFSGTMQELTREKTAAADDILHPNERRDLVIQFHFPNASGNETQNLSLKFDMKADAVQTRNNPDKLFD